MIKNSGSVYMLNENNNVDGDMINRCGDYNNNDGAGGVLTHVRVGDCDQVLIDNFIFSHMYHSDIHVDAKIQCNVRAAAFSLIDDKHLELYKRRIENKYLYYYDKYGEIVAPSLNDLCTPSSSSSSCCHYYVQDAERVIACIKKLECSFDTVHHRRGNVLIFYPYLKQLRELLKLLKKTFVCCTKTIDNMQMYVSDTILHCLLFVEKLELMNKTIKVMNLFADNDTTTLYECNICKEVSNDKRFIKPKECCEFAICNACCVTLWKTATTHAKCPACRTSFKSLN
ncbi:exon0 [Catopsilia pomona nucleopolyhedrovirus]|uniref:Exon0 n=1 Tax=Catopsilia pomona nucleopolyhedrovirus TaxID=1850906 RepID=A0A172WZ94_9ABAC|nr:exon0 [Catopsilia pomona nucleopolyhedrovirus]ANF29665.1 exon0 [Catopsilia pomona nucleopolyhedrovirus]